MTYTFGSLFSGIGGLDLGLERAGLTCVWQSEIDPYACRVLQKHWPHVPNIGDVKNVEWENVATVDVICGGYPCQPFSTAGKRLGTSDERHLWPYFADAVRVLRPRVAVLENVTGHLNFGFGDVLSDMASLGYDTTWNCIRAAAVGAPHRRDRLFTIATRTDMGDTPRGDGRQPQREDMAPEEWAAKFREPNSEQGARTHWSTSEPGMGRMADGVPDGLDRLRALGNAVVPQVAEFVGHVVKEILNANY